MKKLTKEQIKEIAEALDLGESCYLNRKKGTYFCVPALMVEDPDEYEGISGEKPPAEVEEYLQTPSRFDEVHPMPPSDGFEIMKMFLSTDGLNPKLRKKLGESLSLNKPFARFKAIIQERGGLELQAWYAFKNEKQEEWTRLTLKRLGWG